MVCLKEERRFANVLVAAYLADKLAIEYTLVKDIERRDALFPAVPGKIEQTKERLSLLKQSLQPTAETTVGTPCLKGFWSELSACNGKTFNGIELHYVSRTEVEDTIKQCIDDVQFTLNAVEERFG